MGQGTLFDKVWDEHVVDALAPGIDLLHIDRHLMHDLGGGDAIAGVLRRGLALRNPELTFASPDHVIETRPGRTGGIAPWADSLVQRLRDETARTGVRLYDVGSVGNGIVHVVGPELGLSLPGVTIVCGDSHTCSLGGIGALGWGIGTSEGTHVLATQTLVESKPKRMRVSFDGAPGPCVSAKDMVLRLIGEIGAGGGAGHAIEFAGDAVRGLSVEARLTLCNMAVECSAKYGFVPPDDQVFEYLHGRAYAPKGAAWDRAVAHWRSLATDDAALFDRELHIDVSALEPQVTWGTSPQHVTAVSGRVPAPDAAGDAAARALAERALGYQRLQPGTRLQDVPIDVAYIGTCTNARLSDLRLAAAFLRGRKVAAGVEAICIPGSAAVKRDAEAEGLDRVFREAGFEWHDPGCGMCGSGRGRLQDVRVISTSNRNFENRQGKQTRTHLASPLTVAASAVAGHIADARTMGGA